MKGLLIIAIAICSIYLTSANPWPKDFTEEENDDVFDLTEDAELMQLGMQLFDDKNNEMPIFDERFDDMPSHCKTNSSSPSPVPKNCAEATACTRRSGYYYIKLNAIGNNSFLVECDAHNDGGDWLVFQRRLDGSQSFFRTWSQYREGFGEIEGEYFLGMDKLHALTNFDGRQEMMILFERNDATTSYAKYSSFAVGNNTESFELKRVGRYTGTAGDSLQAHVGGKFSTMDKDNGNTNPNMAITYSSAWWYKNNRVSDLNGLFGKTDTTGLFWTGFHLGGKYIKTVKMMIRRYRV
ncbi:ryncolin-4 [Stomoxys calcitrans]|uniref:Fibrinogen C-terminal domain-containing protein n=1 Tax=Stomoxys calcitrans TaxID=35570 RepID=A0A1I8P3L9_STOCA|nr:ryncolin-4 [Stomoxys calcitrans]